jgi:hypothetical protein
MKWRVEFRPEVEQDVADAPPGMRRVRRDLVRCSWRKSFAFGMRLRRIRCSIVVGTLLRISDGVIPTASLTASSMKQVRMSEPSWSRPCYTPRDTIGGGGQEFERRGGGIWI